MKRMSKLISLLLALTLIMGCVQMAGAEGASDLANVDLVYWVGCNPDQKDADLVMGEMKKVALDALNVNLDLVIVATSEFKEKFNKAMSAQERIDLTWTGYIQSIQELVNLGALLPLDDLMAEYGQDMVAALDERLLDAHRSADGLLYQYPAWQGMVGNRSYYMVPKSIVDATVGVEWVQEMEDLMYANWDNDSVEAHMAVYDKYEEMLAAAKEADLLGYGYCPMGSGGLGSWYDIKAVVDLGKGYIELNDETFTVKSHADREWSRAQAGVMADWYDKGYIREDIASIDAATMDYSEGYKDPVSDNCYIMYGHNGFTDDLSKELAGVGKEVYTFHTNPFCWTTLGTATGTSIPFTAAEPERAMMFMNWLYSDDESAIEFYNLYSYGIEGMHYAWDEAHENIDVFGGIGQATTDFAWGQRPWYMGTLLNAYSSPSFPAYYYAELIELQNNAYTSPLLGFSFDYSDVEIEYNLMTAISTEYGDMLNRGYLGVDGWEAKYDEYMDKLSAAGMDDVIAAIQEQVTAFVTEKERVW